MSLPKESCYHNVNLIGNGIWDFEDAQLVSNGGYKNGVDDYEFDMWRQELVIPT